MKLANDGMCFACGVNNPIGLKLRFEFDADEYVTRFTPDPVHQGWVGMTHGGFVCTVMDEVMARIVYERGVNAVTGEITVRFRKPMRIGKAVTFRSRIVSEEGRVVHTSASAVDEDGVLVAEATAKMVRV